MKRWTRSAAASFVLLIVAVVVWTRGRPELTTAPAVPGPTSAAVKPRVVSPSPIGADPERSPGVRVRVTTTAVVGERSAPLGDVEVLAVGGVPTDTPEARRSPNRGAATSDSDGAAVLDLPAAGTWRLTAVHVGFFGATQLFEFPAPGAEYLARFELTPFAAIEGEVVDQNAAPTAGAALEIQAPPGARQPPGPLHDRDRAADGLRAKTGADGRFRVAPVPTGARLALSAVAREGTARRDVEPLSAGETRTVSLRFDPRTDLAGRVVGDARLGPAVVECWSQAQGNAIRLSLERSVKSDDAGAFLFENVEPGTKTLVAVRGRGPETEIATKFAEAKGGIRNDAGDLNPSGESLRLVAVPEGGGERQRAVKLILRAVNPTPPYAVYPFSLKVPSETEVVLRGLPPGRLLGEAIVLAAKAGDETDRDFDVAQVDGEIESGRRFDLLIPRSTTNTTATAVARIEPPAGVSAADMRAQVFVVQAGCVRFASQGETKGIDAFTLGRHAPGDYQLLAVADGWASDPVSARFEAGGRETVVIDRWSRAAAASGTVVDQAGEPLSGAAVYVEQAYEESKERRVVTVLSTVVAADGTFRFDAVPRLARLFIRAADRSGSSNPVPLDFDHGAEGVKIVGIK